MGARAINPDEHSTIDPTPAGRRRECAQPSNGELNERRTTVDCPRSPSIAT
jgi:hypothetical protein